MSTTEKQQNFLRDVLISLSLAFIAFCVGLFFDGGSTRDAGIESYRSRTAALDDNPNQVRVRERLFAR